MDIRMTSLDRRLHHVLRPATLAVLGVLLASCASGSKVSLPNVVVGEVTSQDVSTEGLVALNRFRASQGLGPVKIEPRLVEMAKFQATAMATRDALTHEVAGDFESRVNAAGFEKSEATENVGATHTSAEAAINSWIRSPYHNENMRLKNAKYMGMARADSAKSRYKSYWSLVLVTD
jgi:uncharacterized protein YkwD